jgi:hypothetical protein
MFMFTLTFAAVFVSKSNSTLLMLVFFLNLKMTSYLKNLNKTVYLSVDRVH